MLRKQKPMIHFLRVINDEMLLVFFIICVSYGRHPVQEKNF
jgi:hypothetical protein